MNALRKFGAFLAATVKPIVVGAVVGFGAAVIYLAFHQVGARRLISALGHRVTDANLAPVLSAIGWPVVALAVLIVIRRPLRSLIERIKSGKVGKDGFSFIGGNGDDPDEEKPKPAPANPAPVGGVPFAEGVKGKVGNVFWAGSDLLNLIIITANGANNRTAILHMFRQTNHHLKVLGLKETPFYKRFRRLYDDAEASLESDWTTSRRLAISQELLSIRGELAATIEAAQPGFSGDPKTSDHL